MFMIRTTSISMGSKTLDRSRTLTSMYTRRSSMRIRTTPMCIIGTIIDWSGRAHSAQFVDYVESATEAG